MIIVNPNHLYALYQCTEKNDAPDLATVGMAMFLAEHPEISREEDKAMRLFVGAHGQKLAKAYPDEKRFYLAYAMGLVEDMESAIQREEVEKEEAEKAEEPSGKEDQTASGTREDAGE